MRRVPFPLALSLVVLSATASAATLTVTVSGTGSGSWGSQSFSNAAFTMTFTSDTNNVTQGTPCCSATYTSPAGTAASVSVAGFGSANLTDGQAIFVNQQEATAGVWHYNSPDFLDIGAAPFSTWNLTTSIGPVSGTTFSFATPFSMNPGGSIYFSSVSGVTLTAQVASGGGQPSVVAFTPSVESAGIGTSTIMSFVVSDTAGVSDIQGFDILFSGPSGSGVPADPYACWMWYQASTNSLSIYNTNNNPQWSSGAPIGGASGPTINGDWCSVNTRQSSVSQSGNSLSLNLPVAFNADVSSPATMTVYMNAANNENVTTGYQQVGTFTENPSAASGSAQYVISPTSIQGVAAGSSINYTIQVTPTGGFTGTVSLAATVTPVGGNGSTDPPTVTFNPATIAGGSGTTTMTVAADASSPPMQYQIKLNFTSSSGSVSGNATAVNVIVSNAPPTVSMSPTSGSGAQQQVVFSATDAGGYQNVSGIDVLFNSTVNGKNACWISYDRYANQLWLAGDDGSTWMLVGTVGDARNLSASNSQCVVRTGNSSAHAQGNSVTFTTIVSFNSTFTGTKTWFENATNLAGFSSGYQSVGTWTVP